jgi:hypothetical protein
MPFVRRAGWVRLLHRDPNSPGFLRRVGSFGFSTNAGFMRVGADRRRFERSPEFFQPNRSAGPSRGASSGASPARNGINRVLTIRA